MTIDQEQLFADHEARLDEVTRRAEQVRAGMDRVAVTERSEDGQVAVTVDARGNVTDLRIAPGGRQGPELAQLVMATMRRAQSGLGDAIQHTVPAEVGTTMMTELTDQYRRAYPAPPPEKRGPRQTLRLGAEPDAAPARPARRRPAPGDDPDYADRGLLR